METATYDAENRPVTRTNRDGQDHELRPRRGRTNHRDGPPRRGDARHHVRHGRAHRHEDRPAQQHHDFAYAPNLQTVTDALSHVTTHTFDSHGKRIALSDAAGHTTTLRLRRERRHREPPHDHLPGRRRTKTSTYDAAGRLVNETDQLGRDTTYVYDDVGHAPVRHRSGRRRHDLHLRRGREPASPRPTPRDGPRSCSTTPPAASPAASARSASRRPSPTTRTAT